VAPGEGWSFDKTFTADSIVFWKGNAADQACVVKPGQVCLTGQAEIEIAPGIRITKDAGTRKDCE
jgi:hypothetical protein